MSFELSTRAGDPGRRSILPALGHASSDMPSLTILGAWTPHVPFASSPRYCQGAFSGSATTERRARSEVPGSLLAAALFKPSTLFLRGGVPGILTGRVPIEGHHETGRAVQNIGRGHRQSPGHGDGHGRGRGRGQIVSCHRVGSRVVIPKSEIRNPKSEIPNS